MDDILIDIDDKEPLIPGQVEFFSLAICNSRSFLNANKPSMSKPNNWECSLLETLGYMAENIIMANSF